MRTLKRVLLALIVTLTFYTNAFAASDGSVGANSTGTSALTLTVPEYIVISGMSNFAFGSWNGSSSLDLDDNVIISGNDDQAGPSYKVNITGSGAGGAFTMARSAPVAPARTIAYTVEFNDQTGTGGVSATSGTDITGQTGVNTTLDDVTENANIRVQISSAVLLAARRGTYGGTLTILVTPE